MASYAAKSSVFIVGAKRTPFGAFGGKLKTQTGTQLAVHSSIAALAHAKVGADKVDEAFFGNVTQSSTDASYLARHVALKSGCDMKTPSLTLNRLCGSGFESVCLGAEAIIQGRSNTTLVGGTENMSQAPMTIDGLTARWGAALGKGMVAKDSLWAGLTDAHIGLPMGITAENLAERYNISRQECDEYALRSQLAWAAANAAGVYDAEIAPYEVKGKKGKEMMTCDEHPRANSEIGNFTKLKPVFKEGGAVTAGSASGICDGAASLVLTNEAELKANSWTPMCRLVSWSRTGCDPSVMGIGPVEAIRGALKVANLTIQDMDLVEINEAFAAQFLACEKELGLDRDKCNVNGGAIALGHPLGASGSRIMTHLAHALVRTGKKYAVGAACIGGGQGIAIVVEKC
jgi:acetyl-CoA acyltransferase 2